MMNTRFLRSVVALVMVAVMLSPVASYAAEPSPFVGQWRATDVDGSSIHLAIGGPPHGPFIITWTESYISFCDGEAGIVRGTGALNEGDPNLLEADLIVECFASGAALEFQLTMHYHPNSNTLSTRYPEHIPVIIFLRPGRGKPLPPPLHLRVNYGHDWVEGLYESGHTVWITVTESDGTTVKATAELLTEPKDFWDGETGFQTAPEDWNPEPPDIQPFDWVYGWVDNGASGQVQIGLITGEIDLEADTIQGTVFADWFSQELPISCDPWGLSDPDAWREDSLLPNGEDQYLCSWSGELDIRQGEELGVWYWGPDGHGVVNAFSTPNTRFTVFPEWSYFEGYEWPDGTVNVEVDGKGECSTEGESLDGFFGGGFPEGCDLVVGDVVTFSQGSTTRTHTVQDLAITSVDEDADTVAGTAFFDPELYLLHTWIHGIDESYVQPEVTDGAWSVDFGSMGFDLQPNMGGRAELVDQSSNATAADWYIPNPHFTVFPEWEWMDGYDWPDGTVTVSVAGKGECSTVGVSSEGFFNGGFPEGCDLVVGDVVSFSQGSTTRTHTVQDLAITSVDEVDDTVAGTAFFDPELYLLQTWIHGIDESYVQPEVTDGAWEVNYGFDLQPDMGGRVEVVDHSSNATAADWYIQNPHFTVFPEWEWMDGYNWPDGTVNVSVDGKGVCSTAGESLEGFFNGGFPEGCDLVVGDVVTFSQGSTTRTHTVQDLAITSVDEDTDTVAGTAFFDPELYLLQTWIHGIDESYVQPEVTDGAWEVNYGFDLQPDMGGRVEVVDHSSNATAADWYIPNPHFTVFPEWEWMDGYDWPDGTVDVSVAGKGVCSTVGVSSEGFFNGGFPEGCDLVVGDVVTFSQGSTTRTHTVQDLAITSVDEVDDTVAGTAFFDPELYLLHTWIHGIDESYVQPGVTDGEWWVDFGSMGFDLQPDMGGRVEVVDHSSNATAADWYIEFPPQPQIIAFPDADQVFGYGWPEGSEVLLSIGGHSWTATVEGAPWDPNDIMAFFDFGWEYDMTAGDVLTLSGSGVELTHTLRALAVLTVDEVTNEVTGLADSEAEIHVWVHGHDGTEMLETAASDGSWLADFDSIGFDLLGDMCGRAEIREEGGNATAVDWCVSPQAWVAAFTYDLDAGFWSEGEHSYYFGFTIGENPPGSGPTKDLTVSATTNGDDVPVYDGYVLLRPWAQRAWTGSACENVAVIHPNQPTRFLWGWVTDYSMYYEDAIEHFAGISVQAIWDEGAGGPVDLVMREIMPWTSDMWAEYVCLLTEHP